MKRLFLLLLLPAWPARAAETAAQAATAGGDPLSAGYLLKLILGLLLVLAMIFLFAWAARKMRLTPAGQQGMIRVLSAISVGQRDRIALIQVGEEQILVGLSPGRMHTLHTLRQPLSVETTETEEQGRFADRLQQFMKQGRD